MKRFTVSISTELKNQLDQNKEINWSEIAKQAIEKKIEKLLKLREKGEL